MKVIYKNKIYSGALQFTIFISVIIALILAGAVLLAYTHRFFIEQSKATVSIIYLADSGMAALKMQHTVNADTTLLVFPDNDPNYVIKTNLSHWGIFEKGYVTTTHRNKKFIKCSLLGTGIKSEDRPALYLQETFKPLAIAGTTKIRGNALLPEQGIKPGNILGNSYYGTQLIYGPTKKSTTMLPKLQYDYKTLLGYYLKQYKPLNENDFIGLKNDKKIINSFSNPVKGYFSNDAITLESTAIYGNIIIRSDVQITVKSTADLKDIILVAPIIIIEDEVKGNFQAIANKTIRTGKNCLLNYPTALVVLEEEPVNDKTSNFDDRFINKIYIDTGSVVRGTVCYLKMKNENDFRVNIFVENQAMIKGEIYSEGNLELKGTVYGTVYTNQFIASEGGTVFINHIYNGTIISNELPKAFGGILFDNSMKKVMKWLY